MIKRNLSTEEKNAIVQFILQHMKDGQPMKGTMLEARMKFNTSRRTVGRLWSAAKQQQARGEVIFLQSGRPNAPRRKRVQIDVEMIQNLDLFKRSIVRKLASGINCSKSTVWRWMNKGLIKAHTNAIKPDLTAPNKLLRLRFSLEALQFDRILNTLKFKSMHNTVHIDEKWFYITQKSHRFYLTPGETEPHRTRKIEKIITKVMFMCAVCRPIFSEDGSVSFDGKIGIFPFTQQVPAQRNLKNRAAGTLETKPIQSITKEVIKDCLINQILPSIMSKWPATSSKNIFIQQNNARPHIKDSDTEFREAASKNGFNIRIVHQPPNSPDTNVNDLGWFRAIQSIQIESASYNVDQLVSVVIKSFEELSPMTLNKVFLSLQSCMVEIMKVKGQNSYKIPHMKKGTLIRQDLLPIDLEVPLSLVRECIAYMLQHGRDDGIQDMMNAIGILDGEAD